MNAEWRHPTSPTVQRRRSLYDLGERVETEPGAGRGVRGGQRRWLHGRCRSCTSCWRAPVPRLLLSHADVDVDAMFRSDEGRPDAARSPQRRPDPQCPRPGTRRRPGPAQISDDGRVTHGVTVHCHGCGEQPTITPRVWLGLSRVPAGGVVHKVRRRHGRPGRRGSPLVAVRIVQP